MAEEFPAFFPFSFDLLEYSHGSKHKTIVEYTLKAPSHHHPFRWSPPAQPLGGNLVSSFWLKQIFIFLFFLFPSSKSSIPNTCVQHGKLTVHPPEFYSIWKPPVLFLQLHCPVLGAHPVVYSTIIPLMEVWAFPGFCYFRQWGDEQLRVSGVFCVWRCVLGQIAGSGFIGLNLPSVSLPHKMGCYTFKKTRVFVYLSSSGLSCSTQGCQSLSRPAGSLVVSRGLLAVACGI